MPSSDTIAVKRISGPGFMQEFHYLITPPQALSALINKVELEILETWKKNTEELVEQPKTDFIQVKLVKTIVENNEIHVSFSS